MIKTFLRAPSLLLALALVACRTGAPGPSRLSVDEEFKKLTETSDTAQAAMENLLQERKELASQSPPPSREELNRPIEDRLAEVRQAYESFFKRHPSYVDARIAYGTFLGDQHDEDGSQEQFEKALKLDKGNPAIYNNLANIYGHTGSVKKAFEFYEKAIKLDPNEPVYFHNFATTVFLFRKDVKEFYGIDEQQVFDKALALYSNSMRLDPTNFALASDVALSYYGIKPWRFDAALQSWTNALPLAHDQDEREGVFIHFARIKFLAGRYQEARAHLAAVTGGQYAKLKDRLTRNINEREKNPPDANTPPAAPQ